MSLNRLTTKYARLEEKDRRQFISNIIDYLHEDDDLYNAIETILKIKAESSIKPLRQDIIIAY